MIGIDIVEIKKEFSEHFLERFFTEYERDYADKKGLKKVQTLYGIFAAKEAAAKALGVGLSGYEYTDIEIRHEINGRPIIYAYNKAKELINNKKTSLSISHTQNYAVAVCDITE